MKKFKEIILIDGSSYLYRAFHAMPPLSTKTGLPTGAIKGVTSMLRNIEKEHPNSKTIVVFDTKGKNFRHELLTSYKANRPPMPDELRPQLEPLKEICNLMGMPTIEMDGFEADDLIATLTLQAAKHCSTVIISSLDKDLMQLVRDPDIKVMNTMTNEIFDEAAVKKKFGVSASQIIEYLALVGDSSDNIPGVPKVGPKTASKWLNEYGTIKKLIENADSILGVVGENLRNSHDLLPMNIELVKLRADIELQPDLQHLLETAKDEDKLNNKFQELEFNAWIPNKDSEVSRQRNTNYQTINTKESLDNLLDLISSSKVFALDTETNSLDTISAELVGISFSFEVGEGYYVPINHKTSDPQISMQQIRDFLWPILKNNSFKIVGHNLKFDLPILANHGLKLESFLADTMLMSYISDSASSRHGLDFLAEQKLGLQTISYEEIVGKGKNAVNFSEVLIKDATEYAAEDADITLQLYKFFSEYFEKNPSQQTILSSVENQLLKVLIAVERNGVKIDDGFLLDYAEELKNSLGSLSLKIYSLSGEEFNLESPKQLGEILYNKLQLPVLQKTPKGQPSTNESTLQRLAEEYELPKYLIEYRGLAKLRSTYTESLVALINKKTKRVHTSYHQTITSTGRLSSAEPNLQNIPIKTEEGRKIREAFIPEKGFVIVAADYSQIELRIMAHLSRDKSLNDAFGRGMDVHAATASEIFGVPIRDITSEMRRNAKAINFGLIYGMSAFGLSRQLNITRVDSQQYLDNYFKRYSGVKEYMENIRSDAKDKGYVETILGRRLYMPEINSSNGLRRQAAERAAINAPLQGSAAEIIKKAMIDIHNWCQNLDDIKMIMQVHDELVFEIKEAKLAEYSGKIKNLMEAAFKLSVPLEAEIGFGKNWNEAH
ncbi:MAG: DNA polymerase I [Gammaproteobacteria bacterium]